MKTLSDMALIYSQHQALLSNPITGFFSFSTSTKQKSNVTSFIVHLDHRVRASPRRIRKPHVTIQTVLSGPRKPSNAILYRSAGRSRSDYPAKRRQKCGRFTRVRTRETYESDTPGPPKTFPDPATPSFLFSLLPPFSFAVTAPPLPRPPHHTPVQKIVASLVP